MAFMLFFSMYCSLSAAGLYSHNYKKVSWCNRCFVLFRFIIICYRSTLDPLSCCKIVVTYISQSITLPYLLFISNYITGCLNYQFWTVSDYKQWTTTDERWIWFRTNHNWCCFTSLECFIPLLSIVCVRLDSLSSFTSSSPVFHLYVAQHTSLFHHSYYTKLC
jgi:hypothetical protein